MTQPTNKVEWTAELVPNVTPGVVVLKAKVVAAGVFGSIFEFYINAPEAVNLGEMIAKIGKSGKSGLIFPKGVINGTDTNGRTS